MFSGKSTELLRRIRRYTIAKRSCIVLKYHNDTRYEVEKVSTHDKIVWNAVPCAVLEKVKDIALQHDVIGIDEGQFFPDVVSFCEQMANMGKVVIVAALDGTFQRKPFGSILDLVPIAEDVTKLTAVCVLCQGEASFTKRLGDETEIELIGGEDKYIAVCRTCYHTQKKTQPTLPNSPAKYLQMSPSKDGLLQVTEENINPSKLYL